MKHSRLFMKARAIAFSIITFIAFLWVVLFCVFLSLRWSKSGNTQRAFVSGFLALDVITVVMLPLLLICEFRPYLDAARMTFLLMAHFGVAGGFLFAYRNATCDDTSLDGPGLCQLFNVYIIMSSWVIPALLLIYSLSLAYYTHKNKYHLDADTKSESESDDATSSTDGDVEKAGAGRHATLPMMDPVRTPSPVPKPRSPRPALSIKIPPPGLPDIDHPLPTVSRSAVDERSPFAPRPPMSSKHTSSSSSIPTLNQVPLPPKPPQGILKNSAAHNVPAVPAVPTVPTTPSIKIHPVSPTHRRRPSQPQSRSPLVLHDGDRDRDTTQVVDGRRKSRGRHGSLPSIPRHDSLPSVRYAHAPVHLQMPMPLATGGTSPNGSPFSAVARRHESVPPSAHRYENVPPSAHEHESVPPSARRHASAPFSARTGVPPSAQVQDRAMVSATWGWSVPVNSSSTSSKSTLSGDTGSSRHASLASALALTPTRAREEGGSGGGSKARLVKPPNEIL